MLASVLATCCLVQKKTYDAMGGVRLLLHFEFPRTQGPPFRKVLELFANMLAKAHFLDAKASFSVATTAMAAPTAMLEKILGCRMLVHPA